MECHLVWNTVGFGHRREAKLPKVGGTFFGKPTGNSTIRIANNEMQASHQSTGEAYIGQQYFGGRRSKNYKKPWSGNVVVNQIFEGGGPTPHNWRSFTTNPARASIDLIKINFEAPKPRPIRRWQ